ncbi:MAG: DoxX family protein [Gammaproteobacteria bacterium]|nr:DoxX family protein [Gammaproteobacteria bacterium]
MNKRLDSTTEKLELLGRVLLAGMFVMSGLTKVFAFSMAVEGVSQMLPMFLKPHTAFLIAAGALIEVPASIALLVGWQARWAALALGIYAFLATMMGHTDMSVPENKFKILSNMALVGCLLTLSLHGAGPYSIDAWRKRRGLN